MFRTILDWLFKRHGEPLPEDCLCDVAAKWTAPDEDDPYLTRYQFTPEQEEALERDGYLNLSFESLFDDSPRALIDEFWDNVRSEGIDVSIGGVTCPYHHKGNNVYEPVGELPEGFPPEIELTPEQPAIQDLDCPECDYPEAVIDILPFPHEDGNED